MTDTPLSSDPLAPEPLTNGPLVELSALIKTHMADAVAHSVLDRGELTIHTTPLHLVSLITFLRDNRLTAFKCLIDIAGVDYPARAQRFEVVYHLLSLKKNKRLRVKVPLNEGQSVPSLVSLYPVANWWEREVWDMMGIPFEGHPDLRRILTDYDFKGHPLRKDFPLTGFEELSYDSQTRKIVATPVTLPQDYRSFDFLSPWEGLTPTLSPKTDLKAGGPL